MNTTLRPKVSVIVSAENNADALRYALESVVWQTFVHYEVWVIGNNCRDHSEDVVNSFCDPRMFWFNTPSPVNDFRLIIEGLKRSRGEYVAYLRDTDLWLVNHLESLVDCIENDDQDVVFSITQCIHSHAYSTLSIPMLPDLPVVPHFSSVLHKKNCVFVPMPEGVDAPDFHVEFFQRAMEEKLRMNVVPITTGLRFLWKEAESNGLPQGVYIEKLKNDPDFVNKELSAILFRSQKDYQATGTHLWKNWLSPVQRVITYFTRKHESTKQLSTRNDFPVRGAPG
jgi:glycosyltransferase involved in cell wall biosynthesis